MNSICCFTYRFLRSWGLPFTNCYRPFTRPQLPLIKSLLSRWTDFAKLRLLLIEYLFSIERTMTYLSDSVQRIFLHLCFIMIFLGIAFSLEWGELILNAEYAFILAQLFFLIPAGYFLVNLISHLIRYPDKNLMFDEISAEKVFYSTYLHIPHLFTRILKIALLPLAGAAIIYYYLIPQTPFPYGLTLILAVITIMGSLPALRETLFIRPFRLYVTETGLFYFLHTYEEIQWGELHSVRLEKSLLLFQIHSGPNLWFELNSLRESPIFMLKTLKTQLDQNNILHNLR